MRLEGILLDLVPFDNRFEEHQVEWMNGPSRDYSGWRDGFITRAGYQQMREQQAQEPASATDRLRFGLLTKDGVPIGAFSLHSLRPYYRLAEVGAMIGHPAYWGGGFGSDAMLLITEYGFCWLDFQRLYLVTMGHNLRAQHQVEKCGYTLEGRRRDASFHEGYTDSLVYGLLRDEWPGYNIMAQRLKLHEKARQHGYA